MTKHRQKSTVADTGYQTNSTEKMSAKESASGEEHRMKGKGENRAIAREDDRMTHRGQKCLFLCAPACVCRVHACAPLCVHSLSLSPALS